MSIEGRARLSAQQGELLRALAGTGPPPEDFDAARLRVTADALASKRAQAVARAWPALASELGTRFRERFDLYARQNSLPHEGGPQADGRFFTRMLARQGELSDAGRREALAVDLHFRRTPRGLVPRRGPAVAATFLRQARRLLVAIRLPWLGTRWLTIPLGRPVAQTGPPGE
jgi:hypothetical protein